MTTQRRALREVCQRDKTARDRVADATLEGAGAERATPPDIALREVLRLQGTIGNRAVARLFQARRESEPALPPGQPSALPNVLRARMESLSGRVMDDVDVHYDSPEPARIQALAYTQGTDIHLAPGREHHLAHEAWHAVQQKQGRVPATGTLRDGRAVNADPALEDEAERMARGASGCGAAPDGGRLSSPGPPAGDGNAPIQGVFKFLGAHKPPQEQTTQAPSKARWIWIDEDTKVMYVWEEGMVHGAVDQQSGLPVYMLVVRPQDGFRLVLVPTKPGGDTWDLTQGDKQNPEIENFRLNPGSYKPIQGTRPQLIPSDRLDLQVTEHDVGTATFTQGGGNGPTYTQQAEQQLEGYRSERLHHNLTAQILVMPVEQGQPMTMGTGEGVHDYRYTAAQVRLAQVLMGDKDRTEVGTHLEPEGRQTATPQGRHTVAWALIRRSVVALKGRTVADAIDHLKATLQLIVPLALSSPEARFHLQRINYPEGLELFAGAVLPIDAWQRTLSEVVGIYVQLYHLSEGALFKGKSKQRGEADAVAMFETNEESLRQGRGLVNTTSQLASSAEDLIDIDLSRPARTMAFAAHHWVETLTFTYPHIMMAHGAAVTDDFLETHVSGYAIAKVDTLRELIAHFGYHLPDFAATTVGVAVTGSGVLDPFTITDLKADFVANVAVVPCTVGSPLTYTVNVGGITASLSVQGYTAGDLAIQTVSLSDRDRPPTKFMRAQQSHTVAWTLVRNDLLAYANGPLSCLLDFLTKSFKGLKSNSARKEGKILAEHALNVLSDYGTKTWALHDWQQYVSTLVKWYGHVYQQAKFASFADVRTLGRALGHAEGPHMAALRRNEFGIVNEGALVDTPARVVQAAVALFE